MKKCKYSINGDCTNDRVACEKCNSTEQEMETCNPLHKSTIVYNEKWLVETEMK